MMTEDKSKSGASAQRKALVVTWLVAGAFFMEMLDGTIIVTALPQMGQSFGVSPVDLNIGMTAYMLALAVFIPISGWIADRFGARTVFCSAIFVFSIASLLCGLSNGIWSFAAARALQGMGGAAMVPVGRLIVLRMTEKKHLMRAIGTIVWPGLVAPVLGPPLGGFLVLHASWPWIFFINLPLGVIAVLFTIALIPNARPPEKRPLDFVGFVLSGIALVLTVYGVDMLGNADAKPSMAALFVLGGVAFGVAAIRHFRRHPTPLLDLTPLRLPTYAVCIWGGSALRTAINAVPFILPLMLQLAFGLDAFASGRLVLCVFAGNLAMKTVTTPIIRRLGFRNVLIGNGILVAVSLFACGLLTPATPWPVIALVLFAGGAFRSLQFTALATIQFSDVPPHQLTNANTLANTLSQLMMGAGVVVGAVALNASSYLRAGVIGQPDLTDFQNTFFLIAAIALIGLTDSFLLDKSSGHAVSGRK